MIFLYVLLAVYILAVNFYAFRLVRAQSEEWDEGDRTARRSDGHLILAGALGGAITVYACMFAMRYRTDNLLFMIGMPLLAVFNVYCFWLGFRAITLFI